MNAYNPLEATRRLEAAGVERHQAEAIASEIAIGTDDVVTRSVLREELEAAIDKAVSKSLVGMNAALKPQLDAAIDKAADKALIGMKAALKPDLDAAIEKAVDKATIKLGIIATVAGGIFTSILGILIAIK